MFDSSPFSTERACFAAGSRTTSGLRWVALLAAALTACGQQGPAAAGLPSAGVAPPAALTIGGDGVTSLGPVAFADTAVESLAGPIPVKLPQQEVAFTVSGYTLTGDTSSFIVTPLDAVVVPSGAQPSWNVLFHPQSSGLLTATLRFITDVGVYEYQLTGKGYRGVLSVAPSRIDFDRQRVLTSSNPVQVTLTNTGDGPVTVSGYSLTSMRDESPSFTVDFDPEQGLPATLDPEQSLSVYVTFTPRSRGVYAELLSFSSDSADCAPTVLLSGLGTLPDPFVQPDFIDFGTAPLQQEYGASAQITNRGEGALTVYSVDVACDQAGTAVGKLRGRRGASPADIGNSSCPFTANVIDGVDLGTGDTLAIAVYFYPTQEGHYTGTLTFQTDLGPYTVTLAGTGAAPRLIAELDGALQFAPQAVGTTSDPKTITFINPSLAATVVTQISTDTSDFVVVGNPLGEGSYAVQPDGGTIDVQVAFAPQQRGERDDTLRLQSYAFGYLLDDALAGLRGTGLAPTGVFEPAALAFAPAAAGEEAPALGALLRNTGDADLVVSKITFSDPAAGFSLDPLELPSTVAPDDALPLTVHFTPPATGAASAKLVLETNAGTLQLPLDGFGLAGRFAFDPAPLDLGKVVKGQTGSALVNLQNRAGDAAQVTGFTLGGPGAAGFSFALAQGTFPATVPGGGLLAVSVTFTAGNPGPAAATLAVQASDGSPGAPLALAAESVAPDLSLQPAALDFGKAAVGATTAAQSVRIVNVGTGPMKVTTVSLTGAGAARFTLAPLTLPATVQPGAFLAAQVTYKAAAVARDSAALHVVTDGLTATADAPLTGEGSAPDLRASPALLQFANTGVGLLAGPLAVTVNNAGFQPGALKGVSFTGAAAADFTWSLPFALPVTLQPGGAQTVLVTMRPGALGVRSAALLLDTDSGPVAVSLAGKGEGASLAVSPLSLDFGAVAAGGPAKGLPVALRDAGNDPIPLVAVTLDGPGAAAYSHDATVPFALAGNASRTVNVSFVPTAAGSAAATLHFNYGSGADVQVIDLPLTGSGLVSAPSFTPPALAFGAEPLFDTSPPQKVVLGNAGAAALVVTALHFDDPAKGFGLAQQGLPATVPAGGSLPLYVAFTPGAVGAASGNLLAETSAGTLTLPLAGTGIAQRFAFAPTPLDLGQVLTGHTNVGQANVTNLGDDAVTISAVTVGGANAQEFSAAFAGPVTLAGGASLSVGVTFTAGAVGLRAGTLSLQSSDQSPGAPLALKAECIAPDLALDPAALDFGKVSVGATGGPLTAGLLNAGKAPLLVQSVALGGEGAARFKLSPVSLPQTVQPGASLHVTLSYSPLAIAHDVARVHVLSDGAGGAADLSITGEGVAPQLAAAPLQLAFPASPVGALTTPQAVLATNQGTLAGALTSVAISGANQDDFLWALPFDLPAVQAPGATLQVLVAMKPTVSGPRTATLQLVSEGGTVEVALSGEGLAGKLAVAQDHLDFGAMAVGATPKQLPLQVFNTGKAPLTVVLASIDGAGAASYSVSGAANAAPLRLEAGGRVSLQVSFSPRTAGGQGAVLHLGGDNGDRVDVPLAGQPISATLVADSSVDFGASVPGTVVLRKLHLDNTGAVDATLVGVESDKADFNASAAGLPLKVPAGGSAEVTLSFSPTAEGRITGTLSLWLSGATLPTAQVSLVGTSRKAASGSCSTAGGAWAALLGLLALSRRRKREGSAR